MSTATDAASALNARAPSRPGDDPRFGQLHEAHVRSIYAYVRSLGLDHARADDAVQDVWLRVAQHWPQAVEHPQPTGYLMTIARNLVYDSYRGRRTTSFAPGADPASEGPAVIEHMLESERHKALADCLSGLDDRRRAVVQGLLGGKKHRVICQELGLNDNVASQLRTRAVQQLQKCVEGKLT